MESIQQFAARIKSRYPEYSDKDDTDLVVRVTSKYPEYRDRVDLSPLSEMGFSADDAKPVQFNRDERQFLPGEVQPFVGPTREMPAPSAPYMQAPFAKPQVPSLEAYARDFADNAPVQGLSPELDAPVLTPAGELFQEGMRVSPGVATPEQRARAARQRAESVAVPAFAGGVVEGATAGIAQSDFGPGTEAAREGGNIVGNLAAGAVSATAGPAGPALFQFLNYLQGLKNRGADLAAMSPDDLQKAFSDAGLSGALAAIVPPSVGKNIVTKVASGAGIGAAQNVVDEYTASQLTGTEADYKTAAEMGAAFGASFGGSHSPEPKGRPPAGDFKTPYEINAEQRPSDPETVKVQNAKNAAELEILRASAVNGDLNAAPNMDLGARGGSAPAAPIEAGSPAPAPRPDLFPVSDELFPAANAPAAKTKIPPPPAAWREAYLAGVRKSGMSEEQIATAMPLIEGAIEKNWAAMHAKGLRDIEVRDGGEGAAPDGALNQYAGRSAAGFADAEARGEVFPGKYDQRPRFEIDDSQAKLNLPLDSRGAAIKQGSLESFLDHPQLFDNYPDARNLRARFFVSPDIDKPKGKFIRSASGVELVDINARSPEEARGVLMHEVQHWIQTKEGHAEGGSIHSPEVQAEADRLSRQPMADVFEPAQFRAMAEYDGYRRLAGEVEARDTQARLPLDAAARRATKPYSSENIEPKDAIVRYGDDEADSLPPYRPTAKTPEKNRADFRKQVDDLRSRLAHTGLRRVSPDEADHIFKATGVDVKGAAFTIKTEELRHMLNAHGNAATEAQYGQVPITEKDLLRIPDIIDGYDNVRRGKPTPDGQGLVFEKSFPDGSIHYVNVVRDSGRLKIVGGKTMWKRPHSGSAAGTPGLSPGLTPETKRTGTTGDHAAGLARGETPPRNAGNVGQGTPGKENLPPGDALRQGPKGSFHVEDLPGGGKKAVITLFSGRSDLSTWMHEHAHMMRRFALEGKDEATIAAWLREEGIEVEPGGAWSREAEEAFARGFERFLWDGVAPRREMREVFEKVKTWFRDIYQSIKGTQLEKAIPEHVGRVYARMLGIEPHYTPSLSFAKFTEAREYLTRRGKAKPTDGEVIDFLRGLGDRPVPMREKRQGPSASEKADAKAMAKDGVIRKDLRAWVLANHQVLRLTEADLDLLGLKDASHRERMKATGRMVIVDNKSRGLEGMAESANEARAKGIDFEGIARDGEISQSDMVSALFDGNRDQKKNRVSDEDAYYRQLHGDGQGENAPAAEVVARVDQSEDDLPLFQEAEKAGIPEGKADDPKYVEAAAKEWREKGVESRWFKRWFGKSKTIDEKGKPVVVYHGTDKAFTRVKPEKGAQSIFWVTSDKSSIINQEAGAAGRGKIMDLYATIKNPAGWKEYDQLTLDELEQRGYDGAILPKKNGTFDAFVFDGDQIKSATGNRGTFDSENPSILFQDGENKNRPLPPHEAALRETQAKERAEWAKAREEDKASDAADEARRAEKDKNRPHVGPGREGEPDITPKESIGHAIDYEGVKGEPKSGFISDAERRYSQAVNEAFPIEKVQQIFEETSGSKVDSKNDIRYAIDRVLGAGGSANQHLRENLAPIYQGGKIGGFEFPKLGAAEQRLVDEYVIARDVLWRYWNVDDFDSPVIAVDDARRTVEKVEKKLPEALAKKIVGAADALVEYARDLSARKVSAGIWTKQEYEDITKNPFYTPLLRNFQAVANTPMGKASSKHFTSTDDLKRGHFNVDVPAPYHDPIAALTMDTHDLAATAAKIGVMRRLVNMVEQSPALQSWIRKMPPDYVPRSDEAVVQVLPPRIETLSPQNAAWAKKLEAARQQEFLAKQDDHFGKIAESIKDDLWRQFDKKKKAGKFKTAEAAAEAEKAARETLSAIDAKRARRLVWQAKKLEKAKADLEAFKKLPEEQKGVIEDYLAKGAPVSYLVPKELGDAINGLGAVELAWFAKPIAAVASAFRFLQTGGFSDFPVANVMRDIPEAYFNTGMPPYYALKGLYHFVKKDEVYKEMLRRGASMEGGGGLTRAVDMSKEARYGDGLAGKVNRLRDADAWKGKKMNLAGKEISLAKLARMAAGMKLTIDAPLSLFAAMGEASEQMTRLGVASYLKDKGKSLEEQVRGARQGTLDFRRIGSHTKTANAFIPFLNARIQGIDRMVRTIASEPTAKNFAAVATRVAISAIAPALTLWAWNRRNPHYQEIPSWEKEAYWVVMMPGSRSYIKVPKSQYAQMIVNPAQMIVENAQGTASVAGWEIAMSLMKGGLPIEDAAGVLPHGLKLMTEQLANYDLYFNRAIVKEPGRPAGYQYDQGTYETLKTIGRGLGISPQRLQHLAKGITGGTGVSLLFVLDKALGKAGLQPEKRTDAGYIPFVKRVFGQAETWKSDLDARQRELVKEYKAAKAALGSYKSETLGHTRNQDQAEYKRQVSAGLRAQSEKVKELAREIAAVQKAASANRELLQHLQKQTEDASVEP